MSGVPVTPAMVRHVLNCPGDYHEVRVVDRNMGRMRLVYQDRTVTALNPFALQTLEVLLTPDRGNIPTLASINLAGDTATAEWAESTAGRRAPGGSLRRYAA